MLHFFCRDLADTRMRVILAMKKVTTTRQSSPTVVGSFPRFSRLSPVFAPLCLLAFSYSRSFLTHTRLLLVHLVKVRADFGPGQI